VKTFIFKKPHNYGGYPYSVDQKIIIPEEKAAHLESIGVGLVVVVEEYERKGKGNGRKARSKG